MLKEDIETYNPDLNVGLTDEQVSKRTEQGLANKTKPVTGKSIFAILTANIVSSFNVLYFFVAILFIVCHLWIYLLFLISIIPNIVIGIYWDLKARKLAINNRELNTVVVLRNGKEVPVFEDELVLDDIVLLRKDSKIVADGVILFGNVGINESSLTGKNDGVQKSVDDSVLSGTYVTSGYAKMKVTSIGSQSRCESLYHQASKSERPESPTLTSFKTMFIFIFIIVFILVSAQAITYTKLGQQVDFNTIGDLSTVYIATTPAGLLVISSIALTISIIRLKKKKIRVNELYSLEMLSKADVLCLDKTGTITDSTMRVKTIESLNASSADQISQILSNLLNATKDESAVFSAIKKHVSFMPTLVASSALPFTSENKWSGASFGSRGTYILGEIEHLNIINKSGITFRAEEYINRGYRVLCLGHSYQMITNNKFEGMLEPIALIVLEDCVRANAVDTFKWFRDRGTEIKIISGDDATITSEVAKSVGIQNADKFISLEGKTDEEVALLARSYVVFGDATPEQKEIIINSIKKSGKTVAMVGDGINDVLALKQANCSIALASGSEAARNVSHIVLEDSEFSKLQDIVDEGNLVFNKLSRISALFLTKTVATIAILLAFLIASWVNKDIVYPFMASHMFIWEIVSIILASIFLLFDKNKNENTHKKLLPSVFAKAFFAAFILVSAVAFYFVLYALRVNGYVYFDISLVEYSGQLPTPAGTTIGLLQIMTMAVVTITVFSFAVVFGNCRPLTKYRWVTFGVIAFIGALLLGLEVMFAYLSKGENNLLKLAFNLLTPYQWIITLVVSIIAIAVYLFILKIGEFIKQQEKNEDEELEISDEN